MQVMGLRVPKNLTPGQAFGLSAAIMLGMFALFLVIFIANAAFCYWHQGFDVSYVNNTDESLCVREYPRDTPQDSKQRLYCDDVPPQDEITYSHGYCDRAEEPRSVLVAVGSEQDPIYETTRTCKEWQDNDVRVTVEQTDGRYVATESLRNDE
jgi:hypothetical protein